jgi:hypothetical protein
VKRWYARDRKWLTTRVEGGDVLARERDEAERSAEEKEARRSASGADRMTQNADIAENALSGSTTGGKDINYGMGEEGEPAGSDGSRNRRSDGAEGNPNREDSDQRSGSESGGSRDRRSGGPAEPDIQGGQRHSSGGGLRDRRSGGSEGGSEENLKTHRKRRSSR